MRMLLLDSSILNEATTLGVPQAPAPGGTGECELIQRLLVSLQGRGTRGRFSPGEPEKVGSHMGE